MAKPKPKTKWKRPIPTLTFQPTPDNYNILQPAKNTRGLVSQIVNKALNQYVNQK